MKNLTLFSIIFICLSYSITLHAQDPPINDTVCINQGDPLLFDLSLNDLGLGGYIILQDPTGCFAVQGTFLIWSAPSGGSCPCGEYLLRYFYDQDPMHQADIYVTIKCDVEKPECFLNNLEEIGQDTSGMASCLYACEYSTATYFVPHVVGNSYVWSFTGAATYSTNLDGNEAYVDWGAMGPGTINLTIINGGGSITLSFCVDILEGPVADFSVATNCVCLNGPMSFINNSLGANSYLWDFGDGNTDINPNPTHTYDNPGTYTVTLYAFKNNIDPEGNPLCCCTDSTTLEVTVDPLEGPNIYWISTLCPGDKSYYWTDADACATYYWNVLDASGSPITFTGDGTDTICVVWGDGPMGTITLEVSGCSTVYCDKPSVAIVPIISTTSPIVGDTIVCQNATTTYTLPKWPSVYYDWTVTGGTLLPDQNGSNTVVIQWGSGPIGTIHVDYYSDFLGGLPGHDPSDCFGTADLTVSILPQFQIFGPVPGVACINSVSNFSATASPSSAYTWSVTPFAPITGNGTANISITWSNGPGTFVVSAVPNTPGAYCNDIMYWVMTIIELAPPDSIVGPKEICPGQTYNYLGYTSISNTTLEWTVQGGTPSTYTGSPIVVTWNATGPYSISLAQMQVDPPNCLSDTITCLISPKEFEGPLFFPSLSACINTQQVYGASPAQHADAELKWKISPVSAGSVIAGQGSLTPTIQWNNDPVMVTLTFCVYLCGDSMSYSDMFMLNAPLEPTIIQIGDLCPGQSVVLDATSGFSSYQWSGPVVASTEDITITVGGTYVLTTIDANGCQAIVTFEAVEIPGPVASISTPDPTALCLPASGQSVTISAQTNPNYQFTWFCNGTSVQGPSATPTYTHNGTNDDSSYTYCVIVKDLTTNCTEKSNNITVVQDTCSGPMGNCSPASYSLSITPTNPPPDCAEVNFAVSKSANVTLTSWNFGDPAGNTNTGTLLNAVHTYSKAGYYTATVSGTVPNLNPPPPDCPVTESVSVCIPLAADFEYVDSCLQVCFTDFSTFLPSNNITSWSWDFGDSNSSSAEDPWHSYAGPGTYTVILTVSNAAGCEATHQAIITVAGPPTPTVVINPTTVCVGDAVSFSGSGAGIISWLWDFADGATNGGQNASHTYLMQGNYMISLTVVNINGCASTVTSNVVVYPNPAQDTISYDSTLVICQGDQVMLYAPSGPYTYLWNTGDITSFLLVGTAGDYSVKVTDANGCMMETDPVTVTVVPPPDVEINGPNYICDDGCVTLTATAGSGFTYQWLDAGLSPIGGATMKTFDVCDFMTLPFTTYVEVTDANGCSSVAGPHTVNLAFSPVFTISIVGDTCEGTPNVLSVPILPDVRYQWSTGDTGLSIIALQAGTYTVIGTDTLTGCSHAESAVINPLPDLCFVPTGCYEACNPDTICGPDNLSSYQWNMNGTPLTGETGQCLIVTQSGSYSLTGTNQFNCSLTSDTLILNLIDCEDCTNQDVSATPIPNTECCFSLTYQNSLTNMYGLMMHTADANIDPDLSSLDASLNVFTIGSNYIGLVNSTGGSNLPTGTLNNYLNFCLSNITSSPQIIIFDWYNDSFNIVCSDTLIFDCPIDSDCIYIAHDTIYCEGNQVKYEMTVCNSMSNTFSFNYLVVDPISPFGIIVSPTFFDLTSSPILPGTCQTFNLMLSGSGIANKDFCFNLTAHVDDPSVVPDALCCSLDTLHCIPIPGCTPCDMVYIEEVISAQDSLCCYEIVLNNYYDSTLIDGIDICALSPNTTMTINNPFGSDWLTTSFNPTVIQLAYNGSSPTIPLGNISLPEICIETQDAPNQLIAIKWMSGGMVVCTDTVELNCEPPCGYIFDYTIHCEGDNFWYFEGYIKNTSPFVMHEAHISFQDMALSGYDQTILLGALPPGGSFGPIFLPIGPPASADSTICIQVTLHETGHDDEHDNCCDFVFCFTLPDCGQADPCICDGEFDLEVEEGFSCVIAAGFSGTFMPLGNLTDCDFVVWNWDDGSPNTTSLGTLPVMHTFPSPGEYDVCMRVFRLDVNGKKCKAKVCKEVEVIQMQPNLFPNPTRDHLTISWNDRSLGEAQVKIFTPESQLIRQYVHEVNSSYLSYDVELNDISPGLYFIMTELNGERWIEKLIIY